MSEFPGLETMHGHLDLGQRIGEEAEELLHHHPDHAMPEDLARGLEAPATPIAVKDAQPTKGHYRTFTLDGTEAQEITSPYPGRANLTVSCQAGGPARIGADNQIGTADGDTRSVRLPAGAARTFTHTDKVFAHGPVGTVVDVVEEHFV